MTSDIEKIAEVNERSIEQRIQDFGELLASIESLDDKKRQLWREIYENAISDRQNSYVMFSKLVRIVEDKSTEHAVHGRTIATFLERMSKSNDQLIKLAELIAKAQRSDEEINADDMFDQIKGR
jgi:single-stranded DNA-specific DHH superfamily exonuclease